MDRRENTPPWPEGMELDEKKMVIRFTIGDEDFERAFRWVICGTCDGKGTHVNPSIDAHGISAEEFDEDPDFRYDYFAGVYDVTCYECRGLRVVPELRDPCPELDEYRREEYEYRRQCAMGY